MIVDLSDLSLPEPHELPPIPKLSDLRKLEPREIDETLRAACPPDWREIITGLLDNSNLHHHTLNLPMLLAELTRIRNHVDQQALLRQAVVDLKFSACYMKIYTLLEESGPDSPALRNFMKEALRETIREEFAASGISPAPKFNSSPYIKTEDSRHWIWNGDGEPNSDKRDGEWIAMNFRVWPKIVQ